MKSTFRWFKKLLVNRLGSKHAQEQCMLSGGSYNNLIFFMVIRFPAILLVKTIDSYLHEFCVRGILHSDFQ